MWNGFPMNNKLNLFPAIGINFQSVLSANLDNVTEKHPEDLNAIWFHIGGGLDY
jgi:hypothetical protein